MSVATRPVGLVIHNDALSHNFLETFGYSIPPVLPEITGSWQFSLEFIDFLVRYTKNKIDTHDPNDARMYAVGARKGCYNPPIIDPGYGTLNPQVAQSAITEAKLMDLKIDTFYRHFHNTALIPSSMVGVYDGREATKMDEIIPYGVLPKYFIRFLLHLWDLLPNDQKIDKTVEGGLGQNLYAYQWMEEIQTYEDRKVIPLLSVRSNKIYRDATSALIRFGLVDIVILREYIAGRGRPPVGIAINRSGTLFMEDYLRALRPTTSSYIHMPEPDDSILDRYGVIPAEAPKTDKSVPEEEIVIHRSSELSDVVDDENLRDLFGG